MIHQTLHLARALIMLGLVLGGLSSAAIGQDALAEGQKLLASKDYEAAIEKFDAVLETDERSFDARIGLARAWIALGDPDTANFQAVKAERLKPDSLDAILLTGETFLAVGDAKRQGGSDPSASYAEAIASYRKAAEREPKKADHHASLGYLHYWSNQAAESAASYAAAADLDKKNAAYARSAADSYLLANDLDKARQLIEKAIRIAPDVAGNHLLKGQLDQRDGKTVAAADSYTKALVAKGATDTDQRNAAGGLWALYSEAKDWDAMAARFKTWTQKQSKNHTAWWWLGYVQLQARDFDAALKSYEKADKVVKDGWVEAKFYQGVCLNQLGKTEKALTILRDAGSVDYAWGQSSPVVVLQGMVGTAYQKGDLEEAVRIAEKFALPVAKGVAAVDILNNLGFFLRDWGAAVDPSGKSKKSQTLYKKSRKYYEQAIEAMQQIGEIDGTRKAQIQNDCGLMYNYYDLKDYKTAIRHYKQALAYDETYTDACLNYGRVLNRLGKLEEALDVLSNAAENRDDVAAEKANVARKIRRKKDDED